MLLPQAIHLGAGEKVLYHMRASGWSSAALYTGAVACLATLWLIPLGLVLLVVAIVRQCASVVTITNRRLIAQMGLRHRASVEVPIDRAKGVEIEQSPLGRLCGQGTVVVTDQLGQRMAIPAVMHPREIQARLGTLISNSRVYRLGQKLLEHL